MQVGLLDALGPKPKSPFYVCIPYDFPKTGLFVCLIKTQFLATSNRHTLLFRLDLDKDSFITQDRNDDFEGGQVESTFS